MAFKMKGFPKHKGTKGFTYIPQSMRDKGFQDDSTYDPNFEYDRLGRPINDPNEALNVSKDIMEKRNPGYESTKINPGETTNVFGSLTTSVVSGKNKGDRYADYTEEQHADMLEKATKWFKSREKQFGVGNVDRGNMANSRFYDYLANYGGPESAGGSWLQQRMIDSAYGRVDNEPHIPKDKRMYEEGEWTADKAPKLRTIQKNIRDQYMNIMNDTSNPDFVGGYSDSSNFINKRDAMKLAKTLAPTESLTRYKPIRDNQLNPPGSMTLEEQEIEAAKIDKQTEEDVKKLDETQPIVEEKPVEEPPVEEPPVEEEVVASGEKEYDPRDTNKDGEVDRKEKRAAMFADSATPQSAMTRKNPYEFGTDEYYDFKKTALSKKLGLTKRIFNIYDNK